MFRKTRALAAVPVASLLLVVLLVASGGCGGGSDSPTEPSTATTVAVKFVYQAPTEIGPAVDFTTCTPEQVIFNTHIHPVWSSWEDRQFMNIVGSDRFEIDLQVPVDREVQLGLHDPNNCPLAAVYTAPTTLSANGVLLTRVVSVFQGEGLAFRVSADGTVTP